MKKPTDSNLLEAVTITKKIITLLLPLPPQVRELIFMAIRNLLDTQLEEETES